MPTACARCGCVASSCKCAADEAGRQRGVSGTPTSELVVLHREPDRFDLPYRTLWRLVHDAHWTRVLGALPWT